MMDVVSLSSIDLAIAASLLVLLSGLSMMFSLGLERKILFLGVRMTAQLLFVGLVLRYLFASGSFLLILLMSTVMLVAAGREVQARQKRKMAGFSGYLISIAAMFVSSFSVTVLALLVIIRIEPWYTPQYAIPLLGMLLGNTMTGVSLAIDRMTDQLHGRQEEVEQRLLLGQTWQEASRDIRSDCMRTGMMPIINSMAAAGLVSLPGMIRRFSIIRLLPTVEWDSGKLHPETGRSFPAAYTISTPPVTGAWGARRRVMSTRESR